MAANDGTFTTSQADQQGISGYDQGNPDLKSEKGKSNTLGIVLTPKSVPGLDKFTFTADVYDIQIDDAIQSQGRQWLLDQCYRLGDASACKWITRRSFAAGGYSVGSLDNINQGSVNGGGIHASGIDLTASYSDRLGDGVLTARLAYTRLFDLTSKLNATADPDQISGEVGAPTNRVALNLGYKIGDFALNTTVTYLGESSLDDQFIKSYEWDPATLPKIPAITYVDVQGVYNLNKKSHVYFGINNLLDTKPPLIGTGLPGNVTGAETDSGTYDAIGRRIYAGLKVMF
jgi:outer membrane receptor protein involved in Fe transport